MSWQVWLYAAAVLIPLGAFALQVLFIRVLGRAGAYLATAAIGLSFLLSVVGFVSYFAKAQGVFSRHAVAQAGPAGAVEGPKVREPAVPRRDEPLAWKGGFDWVALGSETDEPGPDALTIRLGLHIDNLAVIMFLMITLVATLIHVYSIGSMRGDPRYALYFAYLSLFSFAMLGLVAASNAFLVFVFWELVGLCSYLLIGFWYEEKKNVDAATKAFVTNRIGDVGMLVGLGILWSAFGTLDIDRLNRGLSAPELRDGKTLRISARKMADTVTVRVPAEDGTETTNYTISYAMLTAAGLGIFAGCAGKSAQFPLHAWLPDAMAGPTPVSALIHAATMVAAGVYLVGRFYPLFTEDVLLVIAYTGAVTLFVAATIALVQTDYKKALAYSTISQLGTMMVALGVGGWAAGLFHLVTQGLAKALLFLGAGSVFHAVQTYEIPVLGGLGKKMPRTAIAMGVGTLSMAGLPFFSGFYSKDAILASAFYRVFLERGQSDHVLLFVLPVIGMALSAFYLSRMWLLIFTGEPRGALAPEAEDSGLWPPAHDLNPAAHAVESPPILTWPLMILAVCALFAGWTWEFGLPIDVPVLERLLAYGEPLATVDVKSARYLMAVGSFLVAAVAIGVAAAFYAPPWARLFGVDVPPLLRRRFDPPNAAERFSVIHRFLVNRWYCDDVYLTLFVRPVLALGRSSRRFDEVVLDRLVDASAWATRAVSRFEGVFDRVVVDGLVRLVGHGVYAAGDWGRSIQTGRLRNYLMFLAVAVVGLCAGVFAWIRG